MLYTDYFPPCHPHQLAMTCRQEQFLKLWLAKGRNSKTRRQPRAIQWVAVGLGCDKLSAFQLSGYQLILIKFEP